MRALDRLEAKLERARRSSLRDLEVKVSLAQVYIPPHVRVSSKGKPVTVKGHYRETRDVPLTDQEWDLRAKETSRILKKAGDAGMATDQKYATYEVGEDGKPHIVEWTPERTKMHMEILDELWEERFASVPREGKASFTGGPGGAGKGTILSGKDKDGNPHGIDLPFDPKKYGTIDPDSVKEKLAARGMVPEVPGLSPMEASALIHEESSWIALMLADRAMEERANLTWDITMSSEKSVTSRLNALEEAGYGRVDVVFVDIPAELSAERALGRWRRGQEEYDAGEGEGGRFVPPELIRAAGRPDGRTTNRVAFEALTGRFTSWLLVDSSGEKPRKVASGGMEKK